MCPFNYTLEQQLMQIAIERERINQEIEQARWSYIEERNRCLNNYYAQCEQNRQQQNQIIEVLSWGLKQSAGNLACNLVPKEDRRTVEFAFDVVDAIADLISPPQTPAGKFLSGVSMVATAYKYCNCR